MAPALDAAGVSKPPVRLGRGLNSVVVRLHSFWLIQVMRPVGVGAGIVHRVWLSHSLPSVCRPPIAFETTLWIRHLRLCPLGGHGTLCSFGGVLNPLWANRVCGVHGLSLHTFGVSAAVGHQHPVGLGYSGTRLLSGLARVAAWVLEPPSLCSPVSWAARPATIVTAALVGVLITHLLPLSFLFRSHLQMAGSRSVVSGGLPPRTCRIHHCGCSHDAPHRSQLKHHLIRPRGWWRPGALYAPT